MEYVNGVCVARFEELGIEGLYGLFVQCSGVATDSRKVSGGEMFFALHGERFDGNAYALRAVESGARVAVMDSAKQAFDAARKVAEQRGAQKAEKGTEKGTEQATFVVVDDTLKTLQSLSRHHRRVLGLKVLAVTGTNGKTTTKELLTAVLSEGFRTTHTVGNLNNHIGVPLTLLAMRPDHQLAIVEMGASAQGEIALLCSLAEPDYGIITNVGRAHLEGFGGQEGVRRGKGELYDALVERGGVAFYRADDAVLASMVAERSGLESVSYVASDADGVEHRMVGDYNRFNVAAALAVGRFFGIADERIRAAIYGYVPTNGRSQELLLRGGRITVDCYNANPSSMAAAIDNHLAWRVAGYERKLLILGDMLELGAWSEAEHRAVVERLVASEGVERVLFVGDNFGALGGEVSDGRMMFCANALEAAEVVAGWSLEGASVLIKGSRGVGLERVFGGV